MLAYMSATENGPSELEDQMLIITLGTIASGSTWVFNVVRQLMAENFSDAVSLSTAEASNLLKNVPCGCRNVLVKSHHVDVAMLSLASLFECRTIATTRDPRDSLVSQRERFGATLREAVTDLSRSAATLAMLNKGGPVLHLRYEDRFTDDPDTVIRIARFLGLKADARTCQSVFDQLRPERVTRAIDRLWSRGKLKAHGFDEASHWHPGHVGDRQIGKWQQRLPPDDQEAVIGAVGGDLADLAPPVAVRWSPKLFQYYDGRTPSAREVLECAGEERMLVWGPYQHLAPGRWQIKPDFKLVDLDNPVTIRFDVFIPIDGRETLGLRMVHLPVSSPERMTIEFDHHNHLEPLELRISSIRDARCAQIEFAGATLEWLGPSEHPERVTARPLLIESS